jgi:hypothetical protein
LLLVVVAMYFLLFMRQGTFTVEPDMKMDDGVVR